jgi:hypothetical protein
MKKFELIVKGYVQRNYLKKTLDCLKKIKNELADRNFHFFEPYNMLQRKQLKLQGSQSQFCSL